REELLEGRREPFGGDRQLGRVVRHQAALERLSPVVDEQGERRQRLLDAGERREIRLADQRAPQVQHQDANHPGTPIGTSLPARGPDSSTRAQLAIQPYQRWLGSVPSST